MSSKEKAEVIFVLRSLLISRKPPVSVQVLMQDYEKFEGKVLDFRKFECQTIKEFLIKSGEFEIEESYNQVLVTAKQRRESVHITKFVSKDKRSTSARLLRRPISSDRNWNAKNKYIESNSNRKNINDSIKSKSVQRADRNNNFKAVPEYRNKFQVNQEMKVSNNANIHTEIPKKNYQSSFCLKSTSVQSRLDTSKKFIQPSNIFERNKSYIETNEKNDSVVCPNEDPVCSPEDYWVFHKRNKVVIRTKKSTDTEKITAQCKINDYKYGTYPNELEDTDTELLNDIHKLLCNSPGGIFKKNIPDFFMKTYEKKLQKNWYELIKCSSLFEVEETIGNNSIVYACNLLTDKEVSQETLNSKAVSMPELIYQWDEKFWDLNVTHCVSTIELYARIIGENYSEQFDSMMNEIERLMMFNKKLALSITVGEIYLVSLSECWHRVRVIKKSNDTFKFLCFFIDFGDEEWVSMTEIFVCEAKFFKLAPQAIKFSLDGLEDFADNQNITLYLNNKLIGKSFVGEIITTQKDFDKNINSNLTKYSPIQIILYDTSTSEDINVNYLILKEICKKIPSKPNQSSSYLVSEVTSDINDLKMGSLVEQNPLSPNALSEIKSIEKLLDSKCLPVIVTMSTSPSNFVARPYENESSFADFMHQLQIIFKKNQILPPEIIEVGETYAALSNDENYYRVTVEQVLNSTKVRVFFCDFGDVKNLCKEELRCLPEIFRNVPKQAIRCTLWDVKPIYDKWSLPDCHHFQDLTKNKKFYAIVKNVTLDKSLHGNRILEVDLLDTSIRNTLIQAGRAVTNYYSNY